MLLVEKNAGSPFHLQDGVGGCSGAVSLMMLSDPDVGKDPVELSEASLTTLAESSSILLEEDQLVTILNSAISDGKVKFSKTTATTEVEGSAILVGHLCDQFPVSPAVRIYGGGHWIAIEGIWVDRDPTKGAYGLGMMVVHDPSRGPLNGSAGHKVGDQCPTLGVPKTYVSYPAGWRERFGVGVGQFRVVGRERLTPQEILGPEVFAFPVLAQFKVQIINGLVDPDDLSQLWTATVDFYGGWPAGASLQADLANVTTGTVNMETWPSGKSVYLVMLENSDKIVGTWVVDARTGESDSIEVHPPGSYWVGYYDRLKVEWAGKNLFWQPCEESFSPHLPFLAIESTGDGHGGTEEGGGAPSVRFERLDGKIFDQLTTDRQGV